LVSVKAPEAPIVVNVPAAGVVAPIVPLKAPATVLLNVAAPVTAKVLLSVAAPVTVTVLLNVIAPLNVCVPECVGFPDHVTALPPNTGVPENVGEAE
jgi:hypothetical protein